MCFPPSVSVESGSRNILVWGKSCLNKMEEQSVFAFGFWLPLAPLSGELEVFENRSRFHNWEEVVA